MKKMKKMGLFLGVLMIMSSMGFSSEGLLDFGEIGYGEIFQKWMMNLGWIITASIGFGLGTGIAIKIFDLISVGIDEWEEVKKGNMGVVAILVSIIIMVGVIVVVSIA
jgi:hypothetical protein